MLHRSQQIGCSGGLLATSRGLGDPDQESSMTYYARPEAGDERRIRHASHTSLT
jgi:hypothetical protein